MKSSTYEFHQSLGQLFYAIAAADKVIRPKETQILEELIRSEWTSEIESNKHSNSVTLIKLAFEKAKGEKIGAEEALDFFCSFYGKNKNLFTKEVKEKIWTTVNSIAESVSGKNKSELNLLSKLSVIFRDKKS